MSSNKSNVRYRNEKGHFVAGKSESPKKAARKTTQAAIIATIRRNVEIKLKKDAKATLGDYIRLVQLQKDLEDSDPGEIRVTWVEPKKTEVEPKK
jgi:hypothetical protein